MFVGRCSTLYHILYASMYILLGSDEPIAMLHWTSATERVQSPEVFFVHV